MLEKLHESADESSEDESNDLSVCAAKSIKVQVQIQAQDRKRPVRKVTSTMFVHMIRPRAPQIVKVEEWDDFKLKLDESIRETDSESLENGYPKLKVPKSIRQKR